MANGSGTFKDGNQWRFSEDCQPSRRMTTKQTLKAIDNIICMTYEELDELILNNETPQFLKVSAQKIIEGDLKYVVDLRNSYSQSV